MMKTMELTLNLINEAQVASAVHLLVETFFADAGMRDICRGSDAKYRQRLAAWFAATLRLQLASHQPILGIEQDGELMAITMLAHSDKKPSLQALLHWTLTTATGSGLGAVWRTMNQDQRRRPFLPSSPHIILEFIAVLPQFQGEGLARMLLDDIHRQAQERGIPVWLETTRPHNVTIFAHFGYRVIEQNAKNGVDYYFMLRA